MRADKTNLCISSVPGASQQRRSLTRSHVPILQSLRYIAGHIYPRLFTDKGHLNQFCVISQFFRSHMQSRGFVVVQTWVKLGPPGTRRNDAVPARIFTEDQQRKFISSFFHSESFWGNKENSHSCLAFSCIFFSLLKITSHQFHRSMTSASNLHLNGFFVRCTWNAQH